MPLGPWFVTARAHFRSISVPLSLLSITGPGNGTKMKRKWNENGTNMERKWNENGTNMEQWNEHGTKMERKWNENETKMKRK